MNKQLFIFFSLFIASCVTLEVPNNAERKLSSIKNKIRNNNTIIPDYSLKARVFLQSPDSDVSLTAMINSKSDSCLSASIRAVFGVEVARVLINTDSVFYVDRVNKTFLKKPISYFNSKFGVNLSLEQIQKTILGKVEIEEGNYSTKNEKDGYKIFESGRLKYIISSSLTEVIRFVMYQKNDIEISGTYSSFDNIKEFKYPKKVNLKQINKKKKTFSLDLNVLSLKIKNIKQFTFYVH